VIIFLSLIVFFKLKIDDLNILALNLNQFYILLSKNSLVILPIQ